MKLFLSFILGFIVALIIIGAYTYAIGSKVDKVLSILEKPQTCNLPYWIENDIRTMANTLDTSTSCTDK